MAEPPKKYTEFAKVNTNHYSGTDLYLSLISVIFTSIIVRTGLLTFMAAHQIYQYNYLVWGAMAVTSIVAGKSCLNTEGRNYKFRVYNSVVNSIKTVFIGPFTAVAQVAYSLTNGFKITRDLFN